MRSEFSRCSEANISCNFFELSPSIADLKTGEEKVKLKNLGYAVVISATAAAFVMGSAGVGEAKAKKKAAAPAPAATWPCIAPDSPVCAVRGGLKFTYANKCTAKAENAKIISEKACPAPKAAKPAKAGKAKAKKADKKAKK
jgi:hypothetical protein